MIIRIFVPCIGFHPCKSRDESQKKPNVWLSMRLSEPEFGTRSQMLLFACFLNRMLRRDSMFRSLVNCMLSLHLHPSLDDQRSFKKCREVPFSGRLPKPLWISIYENIYLLIRGLDQDYNLVLFLLIESVHLFHLNKRLSPCSKWICFLYDGLLVTATYRFLMKMWIATKEVISRSSDWISSIPDDGGDWRSPKNGKPLSRCKEHEMALIRFRPRNCLNITWNGWIGQLIPREGKSCCGGRARWMFRWWRGQGRQCHGIHKSIIYFCFGIFEDSEKVNINLIVIAMKCYKLISYLYLCNNLLKKQRRS
jgi:hypothetical protein